MLVVVTASGSDTVSVYCREPGAPFASVAVRVNVAGPEAVGVPLTAPLIGSRARPAGRVPAVTANAYGPVPLVAVATWAYACPAVGFGRAAGATATAGPTVSVRAGDVPPPGPALKTVTAGLVPAAVRATAGTTAVNRVALTNVVGTAAPLTATAEPATKFVPVRVTVVAGLPAGTAVGLRDASVGTGLVTANVWAAVVP